MTALLPRNYQFLRKKIFNFSIFSPPGKWKDWLLSRWRCDVTEQFEWSEGIGWWLLRNCSICTTQSYCLEMCKCCHSSKAKHHKPLNQWAAKLNSGNWGSLCPYILDRNISMYVIANVKLVVSILHSHLNTTCGAWASFLSHLCQYDMAVVVRGLKREWTAPLVGCTTGHL